MATRGAVKKEEPVSLASAVMEFIKRGVVGNVSFPYPLILLIGLRSSAKLSLVQRIVGFPLSYVDGIRATTRPLVVICQNNPQCETPEITLTDKRDGVPHRRVSVQEKDVIGTIRELMTAVQGFSNEEVVLEITSKDAHNICFMDLPGYEPNSGDMEGIERLLSDVYGRHPNCFILHLMTVSTDAADDSSYRFIRNKLEGWEKKTRTVITKFDELCFSDEHVVDYSRVEALINYFQNESWFAPYFMCNKVQQKGEPVSKLKVEEQYEAQCELLRDDAAYERKVFDRFLAKRSSEGAGAMEEHFGFAKLLEHLIEIQVTQMCDLLPEICQKLTEERESCLLQVQALEKRLASGNPDEVRKRLLVIANTFILNLKKVHNGDATAWMPSCVAAHATDLATELRWGQQSTESEAPAGDEVTDHDVKLLGGSQVTRAMQEFLRDGISRIPEELPRGRILNAIGVAPGAALHGLAALVCSECERIVPAAVGRAIAHLASIIFNSWRPAAYQLALQECGAIDEELGAVLENCFEDWFKHEFDEHLKMARTNIKICSEPKLKNFNGLLGMMISNCEDTTAAVQTLPTVVLGADDLMSHAGGVPSARAIAKGAFALGNTNRENFTNLTQMMRKPHPLLACVGSVTNTDAALDEVGKQAMSCIRSNANVILISLLADLQYWVIDSFLKSLPGGLFELIEGTEHVMSQNQGIKEDIMRRNELSEEYEKDLQICARLIGKLTG